MARLVILWLSLCGAVAVLLAQQRVVDFEKDAEGDPPSGFSFGHTANVGKPGAWIVTSEAKSPKRGKFLAQTDPDATRRRFPVAVLDDVSGRDIELSVRFKPVSGRIDQAAGLVWRYRDENNYYIVRANALENNVVLYKVQGGKRTDLPLVGEGHTYGKKIKVPSGVWSELGLVAAGNRFQVFLDGQKLYEVEDDTFRDAGKVGVWTKADSVTYFDDLRVTVK